MPAATAGPDAAGAAVRRARGNRRAIAGLAPARTGAVLLLLLAAGCGGSDGGVTPTSLPSVAESSCRAAVVSETGSGSARILGSSGTTVTIRAPGGTWTCRATASGDVVSLRRNR